MIFEVIVGVSVVAGALLVLGASVGIIRFPSVPARLHAASKPQVMGWFFFLVAIACAVRSGAITGFLVLAFVLQLLTIPISAHIVARTLHRTSRDETPDLVRDDLDEVL